jgi:hypothetical protein
VTQNKLDSSLLSYLLDRANHTGSQLAATISDFASAALAAVTWGTLTGKPSTFPPSSHTHPASDLTQSGASTGDVLQWNGTAWAPAAPSSSSLQMIVLKDVKAQNSYGQTLTNNAWNKRDINTEETDTGSICTLSNSQFTLPAGTYLLFADIVATVYNSNRQSQFRLRDVTNSADMFFGTTFNHAISTAVMSQTLGSLRGVFTINNSTTFEIQEYVKISNTPPYGGYPANFSGMSECYLTAVIIKVA